MRYRRAAEAATALAVALGGAVLALVLVLPAPALIGSTIAVAAAALGKVPMQVPRWLQNTGFAVIGATLGAGVTPDFLSEIVHYPASLALLTLAVALMMVISSAFLVRFFGLGRSTALLATSPGALSYTLALAAEGRGDIRAVMVLQSTRLLLITLILPPLLTLADPVPPSGLDGAYRTLLPLESMVLLAGCGVAGLLMERFRAPAAFILGGLLVSGIGHGTGLLEGRLAEPVTFIGFAIAGGVIGTRFGGLPLADLRRLGLAGVLATIVAVSVSALVSLLLARVTGIPFAQVLVAFAPGGVEGMSAMALALGYDPLYVAIHHIYRIMLLIVGLPFVVSRPKPARE